MILDEKIMNDIFFQNFSKEIIQCYLDLGLNIDAKDPNNYDSTLLMRAVWYRGISLIQYILEQGPNVNAQNNLGETSLMIAIKLDAHNIVHYLLKYDADPCIENKEGYSPLSYAKSEYKKAKHRKYLYQMEEWSSIIEKLEKSAEKLHGTKKCVGV